MIVQNNNSFEIIENYQKDDDRIILIKHDLNKGRKKIRIDGTKITKGKYIKMIEGDDALMQKNIPFSSQSKPPYIEEGL